MCRPDTYPIPNSHKSIGPFQHFLIPPISCSPPKSFPLCRVALDRYHPFPRPLLPCQIHTFSAATDDTGWHPPTFTHRLHHFLFSTCPAACHDCSHTPIYGRMLACARLELSTAFFCACRRSGRGGGAWHLERKRCTCAEAGRSSGGRGAAPPACATASGARRFGAQDLESIYAPGGRQRPLIVETEKREMGIHIQGRIRSEETNTGKNARTTAISESAEARERNRISEAR